MRDNRQVQDRLGDGHHVPMKTIEGSALKSYRLDFVGIDVALAAGITDSYVMTGFDRAMASDDHTPVVAEVAIVKSHVKPERARCPKFDRAKLRDRKAVGKFLKLVCLVFLLRVRDVAPFDIRTWILCMLSDWGRYYHIYQQNLA